MKKAAFAMGCFWHSQNVFDELKWVKKTTAGYMGGSTINPSYVSVCTGLTGHAETVLIEYDSKIITYEKLLDYFFKNHDPTTMNKQGPDYGIQYKSIIFYYTNEQKNSAIKAVKKYQKILKNKIVTEIVAAQKFYPAEEYHQHYNEKHKGGACHI